MQSLEIYAVNNIVEVDGDLMSQSDAHVKCSTTLGS